jgi:transposase
MSQSRTLCIGMDVHNDSSAVASMAQEHGAEVLSLGTLGPRPCAIAQMVRKRPATAPPLILVYAAGPWGSWLSRSLTTKGSACWVVAPSLRPTKPGERVQTDRRDAVPLARLARSGDLPAVSVPKVAAEARRALPRARAEALRALQDAPCRLTACVLRHAIRSGGRAHGGLAHLRWLSAVLWPTPAPQSVLQAEVRAVRTHRARLQRLEQARHAPVHAGRVSPGVEALQARRGVPGTVAGTLVAAMGARTRCESPRALRQFLGLSPSASASGAQRRPGAIPQAGTPHARRVLVAGAWASRAPATVRRPRPRRLAKQPTVIQALSGTAQVRRCQRSRRRVARGTHAPGVTVAMARARRGCRWAMAQEGPRTPAAQDGWPEHV